MIISNIARLAALRLRGLFRIPSALNLPVKPSPSQWSRSRTCDSAHDYDALTSPADHRLSPELMLSADRGQEPLGPARSIISIRSKAPAGAGDFRDSFNESQGHYGPLSFVHPCFFRSVLYVRLRESTHGLDISGGSRRPFRRFGSG